MSIRHVVCFRFRKDAPEDAKRQVEHDLRKLPSKIAVIRRFEVGQDLGLDPARNHDLAVTGDFDNRADYEEYAKHPAHMAVVQRLRPLLDLANGGRVASQIELGAGPRPLPPPALPLWRRPYDVPLVLLYCYFTWSCTCIETTYCAGSGPMDPTDQRFMMPETYEYASANNPLFLQRPEWLRVATCFSAYGLLPFYLAMLVTFLLGFEKARPVAFVLAGLKLYALGFYHYLEFTSDTPPPNLVNYWLPEGPYLVALVATVFRMRCVHPFQAAKPCPKKQHAA